MSRCPDTTPRPSALSNKPSLQKGSENMRTVVMFILVSTLVCSCTLFRDPKRNLLSRELAYDPTYMTRGGVTLAEARTHMDKTVYPKVEFSNIPTGDALSWLVHYSSEYSPNPPIGQSISSINIDPNVTITLSASNLSFTEILNAICDQSNRWWGFRGSILMTFPNANKEEILTREQTK